MHSVLFATVLLAAFPALAQSCPSGQVTATNEFGATVCKDVYAVQSAPNQQTNKDCPPGSRPSADTFGFSQCVIFDGSQKFRAPADGCRAGTQEWVDARGNRVCKETAAKRPPN